jgi:hypothetical protein
MAKNMNKKVENKHLFRRFQSPIPSNSLKLYIFENTDLK